MSNMEEGPKMDKKDRTLEEIIADTDAMLETKRRRKKSFATNELNQMVGEERANEMRVEAKALDNIERRKFEEDY